MRSRRIAPYSHLWRHRAAPPDDWGSDEAARVFVPGLMGAGILLSGAILISDGVRRLFPSQGVRRRLNVVHGVRRIIVDLAEAAGMEIEERNLVRRERRTSWLYLGVSAITLPIAFLVVRWGINAYSSAGSSLEGNAMAIFYGTTAGAIVGAVGLVGLTLIFPRLDPPRPVAWLVDRTVLGRLTEPPDGVAERARLLIPNLDKGASS